MARELRWVGPPGCGKTTELTRRALQAANHYGGENVMVCSLTKAAGAQVRQEIQKQGIPIPERAMGTQHSMAFAALGGPPIVGEKELVLWGEYADGEGKPYFRLTSSRPDADEAASENHWGGETLGDQCFETYQVARARMQPVEGLPELVQDFAKSWETWKEESGRCDFTDLLEWAYRDVERAPGSPGVIFADEAQDMSMLGMRLLRKWGQYAEHLVIFGDPLQNLYQWAGTDPDAFTTPDVPEGQKRILTQSYRVPRAVHATACDWIAPLQRELEAQFGKPIEYFPRDAEGEVRRLSGAHWKYPEAALHDSERYLSEGKTVMFQAACSHMLDPLIQVLRREGIPFHNPWRTKRGDWNPLARRQGTSMADRLMSFLRYSEEPPRAWSAADLWRWVEVCEAKGLVATGKKREVEALAKGSISPEAELGMEAFSDLFDTEALVAAVEASESASLTWLEERLLGTKRKAMDFPMTVTRKRGVGALREKPKVIVGTGHSLKGSEADVVYVFPDLSRSGMLEWIKPGNGRDGIRRLFYVMMTRARESLVLCGQATPDAVSLN